MIKTTAKGRICLFGEHQDYLGLPVIACSIDRSIEIEGQVNRSDHFRISLPDIDDEKNVPIVDDRNELEARDYFGSAIRVLRRSGLNIDQGHDVLVRGDIPINSGLSSSSALCVAWIRYLLKAFSDKDFTPDQIGYWAYESEVLEHGEPGGMMDHMAIAHEGLVHIQTTTPYETTPLEANLAGLVIADSGQKKSTLEVLAKAKDGGLRALEYIRHMFPNEDYTESTLKDIDLTAADVSILPYLKATIGNHSITQKALRFLQSESIDHVALGQLMNQHQDMLKYELKVSTPELDHLIDTSLGAGAYGAKLVGSGGGGCIVAIASGRTSIVMKALDEAGAKEVFLTR